MHPATGFLLQPFMHLAECESPLSAATINAIESVARSVPGWIRAGTVRQHLRELPAWDTGWLTPESDARLLERLMLLYGYFASAYIHGASPAAKRLPANVAVPLTQVARCLNRPPMLSYAGMVLNNWRLQDESAGFVVENIEIRLTFTGLKDEAWFFQVHVAIEARSGAMLHAVEKGLAAAASDDDSAMLVALREIIAGLVDITKIFHRMGAGCDPDVFYHQVRPYLFGFEGVVYEGISAAPQHFRGGSGAQSSVVPALLAGLGIQHAETQLTGHLQTMRAYMPAAHRRFIDAMAAARIREFCAERPPLRDAYNHVLRQLMIFRRSHLFYARTYIFEKSTATLGTGGTQFMEFLARLIQETEAHLLR